LLEEKGHRVALEPLLEIVLLKDAAVDLTGVQALLFTSANGVRAFAQLQARRDLPVYAVGDSTARAALEAGFAQIESANGDVDDLARLVGRCCDPAKGALLHPAASQLAGDLAGLLSQQGFEIRRAVIYEAKAAERLSEPTIRLFQENAIDGVLFFSPRTAQSFASLANGANIQERLASVTAYALSEAVAKRLECLSFRTVRIAESPDQAALLDCIDEGAMNSEVEPKEPQPSESQIGDAVLAAPIRTAKKTLSVFLLGGVLGIALVAGAGALLWPLLVDSLKKEVIEAEAPVSNATASSDAITALHARDEALAKRLADLESKAASAVEKTPGLSPEEQQRLSERFQKIEQEMQALSAKRQTGPSMLLAALLLREANQAGRNFVKELDMLARLGEGDEDMAAHLAALKPLAETGTASQETLNQRFAELKPLLLRSTMDANEDLWTSVKRRLAVLISIRRTDAPSQDRPGLDGIVTRAEAALAKHDPAGAAATLSLLAGPAGDLAKPWLEQANAHVEADKHVQALLDRAMALTVKP
jgi:uroporphyrinogen-III synthase